MEENQGARMKVARKDGLHKGGPWVTIQVNKHAFTGPRVEKDWVRPYISLAANRRDLVTK